MQNVVTKEPENQEFVSKTKISLLFCSNLVSQLLFHLRVQLLGIGHREGVQVIAGCLLFHQLFWIFGVVQLAHGVVRDTGKEAHRNEVQLGVHDDAEMRLQKTVDAE